MQLLTKIFFKITQLKLFDRNNLFKKFRDIVTLFSHRVRTMFNSTFYDPEYEKLCDVKKYS